MIRIGVDVGGTNTDAVVMDGTQVVAWAKTTSTPDATSGLVAAAREALARSGVAPGAVRAVMVGTTRFTNAVIERRGLAPTAVVRLGLPATLSVPPLTDWPADLRSAIDARTYIIGGGHEMDGREIAPLDETGLRRIARRIRDDGYRAVAVVGVFSPVVDRHERRAEAILCQANPELACSLSHEVGRLGLLASRGKPRAIAPTSVVVPPTSMTIRRTRSCGHPRRSPSSARAPSATTWTTRLSPDLLPAVRRSGKRARARPPPGA